VRHNPLTGTHTVWARLLKPDTVTQSALRVIGRRAEAQLQCETTDTRYGKDGYRLDLRGINLQAIDISGLEFSNALLFGARMEGANLDEVRLERAQLREARMEGSNLGGARMKEANLKGAHLDGAFLIRAQMDWAFLELAGLQGAYLEDAQLEGAFLMKARMEGANLAGARMEGANLSGARMDEVVLYKTRMNASTSFSPSTLRGAGLKEINLSEVHADRDRLSELLSEAFGDHSVRLPEGVERPPHWPEEDLEESEWLQQWNAFRRKIGYVPPDD